MAQGATSGKCERCGGRLGKGAMSRHLRTHLVGGKGAAGARRGDPDDVPLLHLLVEGWYRPEYWMHLEADGEADLEELDGFLREEWLECCGHMSQFLIGDRDYVSDPGSIGDDALSMHVPMAEALPAGRRAMYEYDFGSTTTLRLRVVSVRRGIPDDVSVRLLARNDPPERRCAGCGAPAVHVCTSCRTGSAMTHLCGACGRDHGCGEDALLPVVDSPRCGVCAYRGRDR